MIFFSFLQMVLTENKEVANLKNCTFPDEMGNTPAFNLEKQTFWFLKIFNWTVESMISYNKAFQSQIEVINDKFSEMPPMCL